jgi:hypothetical protein
MSRRGWGWPAIALACWMAVAAAAVVGLTPIPGGPHWILLIFAAIAFGYGMLSRRWLLAATLATVAALFACAGLLGLLPDGSDATYRGPAESVAPRAAWLAAALAMAFDLALALRRRRPNPPPVEVPDDGIAVVHQRLDALRARVASVKEAMRP